MADLPRCRALFIRCTKSIFVLLVVPVASIGSKGWDVFVTIFSNTAGVLPLIEFELRGGASRLQYRMGEAGCKQKMLKHGVQRGRAREAETWSH